MTSVKRTGCCADSSKHTYYRAETPSGWAVCCKKCGCAWPADAHDAALAEKGGDA